MWSPAYSNHTEQCFISSPSDLPIERWILSSQPGWQLANYLGLFYSVRKYQLVYTNQHSPTVIFVTDAPR